MFGVMSDTASAWFFQEQVKHQNVPRVKQTKT